MKIFVVISTKDMATQTRSKTAAFSRESSRRSSRVGSPVDPAGTRTSAPAERSELPPGAFEAGASRTSPKLRHSNPPSEAEVTMMVGKGKGKETSPPRPTRSARCAHAKERLKTLFATFDQKVTAALNEIEDI